MPAQAAPPPGIDSVARIKLVLHWLFATGAALTLLTHIAQLAQLSFTLYAFAALILALTVAACAYFALKAKFISAPRLDTTSALLVATTCLVGMLLALILNRPNVDDYYYVPNAVYYVQHPSAAMGFEVHFLYNAPQPLVSAFYSTSGAYEYVQAAAAHILGVNFLTVYYVLGAAVLGFMIPLAIFLLLIHFSDHTTSAAVGTLVTTAAILLMGETDLTFGNMSLARAFEGKTLLLVIGVPLFASFSLDYFKRPDVTGALALFCLATTMVGASASAVFVLPALAVVLLLAHMLTAANPARLALLPRLGYVAGLSYVVLYALFALTHGAAHLGVDSPANFGWPTDFAGHAGFFINPDLPVTPIALIVSTGLALWLLRGERRRFLALWIVLSVLLFLNPIVAPFLIEHMTSPNAYWRLFFIYPFPLTLGICASALFGRLRNVDARWRLGAVGLVCALLLAGNFVLPAASIFQGRDVIVGRPGFKIQPRDLAQAAQVIAIAPEGPMLAPRDLAGLIVMLDSNGPQLRIRDSAERAWFSELGHLDEAELRISASNYLQGGADQRLGSLQGLLQEYPEIRSVVARAAVYKQPALQSLLAQHGFTHNRLVAGYVIAWR